VTMPSLSDILERARVVAIARGFLTSDRYVRISRALTEGGVDVQEFTVDGPRALEAIREVHRHAGDGVLLGAGTVRSGDSARRPWTPGPSSWCRPA
jgi:2-dehydro-3-deoxyphosphogluconate aldolase / (4S)-4-hydroxy-2-oxoglutarate aldolase